MFIKLLLLFTIVPMVELSLLIKLGGYIGVMATILLVAFTGVVGVSLARNQGFIVVTKIKETLNRGQLPADDMIGALLILAGGIMLLTPGLLTDITGFSLIIPYTRKLYTKLIKSKFREYIKKGNVSFRQDFNIHVDRDDLNEEDNDFVDVDFEEDFADEEK